MAFPRTQSPQAATANNQRDSLILDLERSRARMDKLELAVAEAASFGRKRESEATRAVLDAAADAREISHLRQDLAAARLELAKVKTAVAAAASELAVAPRLRQEYTTFSSTRASTSTRPASRRTSHQPKCGQ